MASTLTLVSNPGSASRKYALFVGEHQRATLHFEQIGRAIVCTLHNQAGSHRVTAEFDQLDDAANHVLSMLQAHDALKAQERIGRIGIRIVAPGSFFLKNHYVDAAVFAKLEALLPRAPLHIAATLQELRVLRAVFGGTPIVGVSDSAFHATKPDHAWNYGISLADADKFEVKRFGYHGISTAAVVHTLRRAKKLPPKLVIAHLGSGASVTAVHGGKSADTTMGYSPLEGIIMSTRSGSIDFTAARVLKDALLLNDNDIETYLNKHGGLLGLGGSADLRELLRREAAGDHRAQLAINTYVYAVQKAIGQMVAALGGVDVLVFTGTVGERNPYLRERIVANLHYLDLLLDAKTNKACTDPTDVTVISRLAHSKPVLVVPATEAAEIARQVQAHT